MVSPSAGRHALAAPGEWVFFPRAEVQHSPLLLDTGSSKVWNKSVESPVTGSAYLFTDEEPADRCSDKHTQHLGPFGVILGMLTGFVPEELFSEVLGRR